MANPPPSMSTAERDINDLFDDIVLTEERLCEQSYAEGYTDGQAQGNLEGYKLGYAQGVQLGEELGDIYGTVVAHLQLQHTEKVRRTLQQLRQAIERFPRDNDPQADIIGAVEDIRTLNKRVRAMLHLTPATTTKTATTDNTAKSNAQSKDFSF